MKRITHIFLILICPLLLQAQNPVGNYNPFVNNAMISPTPLFPLAANGKGILSFNIGNTGSDPLEVFTNHQITLTITLSYGESENPNPLTAIGGSFANLFSWSYNDGTYSAVQIASIPSNSTGTISIAYKVSKNSSSPGLNGFNVNISPAPYQTTSNTQSDDAISSYTYTEIRDYGDAPVSYGSCDHIIDFNNYLGASIDGELANQPSNSANGDDLNGSDDEDGVEFPISMQQGETISLPVAIVGLGRLNAWIDWNGDGDFADPGEQVASNILRSDGTENLSVTVPQGAIISEPTFARFRFTPSNIFSPSGSVNGGEVEDYRISIQPSSFAPTVPTELKIDSSSVSSVSISWHSSTDNVGVTGYKIYRDGILLETTTALNHTDNTVSPGNSYTYSVSAINGAGNESAQSSGVTASTNDTTSPTVPSGLIVISSTINSVSISWDASTDNLTVTGYRIYRDGMLLDTSNSSSYTDNSVIPGNSYTYTVSAIDAADNESAQSSEIIANTDDINAPSIPSGLQLSSSTESSASFFWEASTDNVGVTAYRIYRSGIFLETTTDLFYTDNTVLVGNSYTYTISAVDDANNESSESSELIVEIIDVSAPTVPTGLQSISATESGFIIAWNASTDNVKVTGYYIYRDGVLISTTTELTYTDNTISAGNFYNYSVSSIDAAGNESEQSEQLILSITSIAGIKISQLSIYPNPSHGEFVIEIGETSGKFNLEINSGNGIAVIRKTIYINSTSIPLNVKPLESGIYTVRLFNDNRVYFGKLLILK